MSLSRLGRERNAQITVTAIRRRLSGRNQYGLGRSLIAAPLSKRGQMALKTLNSILEEPKSKSTLR